MKLSNKFTLCRVVLSPVFFILYFLPIWLTNTSIQITLINKITGFVLIPLLAFMEFTDFLDGFSARRANEVSDFGKLFDPFADVIEHLTTFACFAFSGYFHVAFLILIIYREFTMNFIRMVAAKKGVAIAARKGGKFKTVLYVVTGFVALLVECVTRVTGEVPSFAGGFKVAVTVLAVLSVIAAYASFIDYITNFKSLLVEEK